MKNAVTAILALRANVLGTVLIVLVSSVSTAMTFDWLRSSTSSSSTPTADLSSIPTASVLDCETGVYSPVQRTCVDKETFDAEMHRLFSALGIDTSIYGINQKSSDP